MTFPLAGAFHNPAGGLMLFRTDLQIGLCQYNFAFFQLDRPNVILNTSRESLDLAVSIFQNFWKFRKNHNFQHAFSCLSFGKFIIFNATFSSANMHFFSKKGIKPKLLRHKFLSNFSSRSDDLPRLKTRVLFLLPFSPFCPSFSSFYLFFLDPTHRMIVFCVRRQVWLVQTKEWAIITRRILKLATLETPCHWLFSCMHA